jgi:hypothetical protein
MNITTANSIEKYLKVIRGLRKRWKVRRYDELWFPAEDARHYDTRLRPRLYRPREGKAMKRVGTLQSIENDLYEEFIRWASALSDETPRGDEDWDWYGLVPIFETNG